MPNDMKKEFQLYLPLIDPNTQFKYTTAMKSLFSQDVFFPERGRLKMKLVVVLSQDT